MTAPNLKHQTTSTCLKETTVNKYYDIYKTYSDDELYKILSERETYNTEVIKFVEAIIQERGLSTEENSVGLPYHTLKLSEKLGNNQHVGTQVLEILKRGYELLTFNKSTPISFIVIIGLVFFTQIVTNIYQLSLLLINNTTKYNYFTSVDVVYPLVQLLFITVIFILFLLRKKLGWWLLYLYTVLSLCLIANSIYFSYHNGMYSFEDISKFYFQNKLDTPETDIFGLYDQLLLNDVYTELNTILVCVILLILMNGKGIRKLFNISLKNIIIVIMSSLVLYILLSFTLN